MLTKTTSHIQSKTASRRRFVVDAEGVSLGRLATLAANLLRGKGKTTFSSHVDQGDSVVVINAAKVVLTGAKATQKIDFRASGYRGGQTYTKYGKLLSDKPDRAVELAVYGMLPKNRLRDRFMRRLTVSKDGSASQPFPGAIVVDTKNPKIKSGGPFVLA